MKVISFFSYKGGAGRTVACGNIAAALASDCAVSVIEKPLKRRVALIDLDVFSSGTHRVFEIPSKRIDKRSACIQDFLLNQIQPEEHVKSGAIRLADDEMGDFRELRGATGNCREDFLLFPARPDPRGFTVAKYHENLLLELLLELERADYDYVILDGEAGARSMADVALRLSDVIVMLFRLTWQHVEGTLAVASALSEKLPQKHVYLLPTCVPLVDEGDKFYWPKAPGLDILKLHAKHIPQHSGLNDLAQKTRRGADGGAGLGHFWDQHICIHESLILIGCERVLVFDNAAEGDRAARDYYAIARELNCLHPPS